jgi:hypothetical protein
MDSIQFQPEMLPVPLICYDNEDIEGWLVEEGIGYFDCGRHLSLWQ